MPDIIAEIDDVSMLFNLSREKVDNIKEYVLRVLQGKIRFEEFWALRRVTFRIERGQSLGILGLNGSGKSTLLKIIAGVMKPTKGRVAVYGTVAPLIELGAGFDIELTAKENIYLNGAILGYSRAHMNKHFDDIVEFSELAEFVDVPVKNFSSGMVARLGFAIATISKPDILIADEILSVGDHKFQKKSEERIASIVEHGATVIMVSHSIESVKKLCTKALLLHRGEMIQYGEVQQVCDTYMNFSG